MLDGFATPSRIFGLAFKQKKLRKKYGIFYKFASKLKRCSKLPSLTVPLTVNLRTFSFKAVLRSRDLLVRVRFQIRGSAPLTNGSGFVSGYCYFHQ
jgi:hypothetical protein